MRDAIQGFAAVLVSHVASANGFQACTIVERGASGPGGSNKLDQQRFWLDVQNSARVPKPEPQKPLESPEATNPSTVTIELARDQPRSDSMIQAY